MLNDIPLPILQKMQALESWDARDRVDGTPRLERLRQIPPETGKFIALMFKLAPPGEAVEIGTSAGYSTLWLSLAARARNQHITSYEILPEKAALARDTFETAQVSDWINLVEADALQQLAQHKSISFCFLDAEKEVYQQCYDLVLPKMCPGGILIADNAINHAATLQPMIDHALNDERVDSLVLPIGKGLLFCCKKGF